MYIVTTSLQFTRREKKNFSLPSVRWEATAISSTKWHSTSEDRLFAMSYMVLYGY